MLYRVMIKSGQWFDPPARGFGVHIPLPWMFEWALPGHFLLRLLDLEMGGRARHLTRTLAESTGQTVNGYITNLCLAHARRLLTTTDRTILDILHDAGFSCTTQCYRPFRAQTGLSPRGYRRQAQ